MESIKRQKRLRRMRLQANKRYKANPKLYRRRSIEYHRKHRRKCIRRMRLWWKKNKKEQHRKQRQYRRRHRAEIQLRAEKNRRNIKREVIDRYGKVCRCCRQRRIEFLTLEHPKGNGRVHRRRLGSSGNGQNFYYWLKKHGFPAGYEVLCWNCNCAKGKHGKCPHELDREKMKEKKDADMDA